MLLRGHSSTFCSLLVTDQRQQVLTDSDYFCYYFVTAHFKILSARFCLLLFCLSAHRHIPSEDTTSCQVTTPPDYPVSFPGSQQTKQCLTGKPNCNFPTGNLKEKTENIPENLNKDFGKFRNGGIGGDRARTKIYH